MKHFTALGALSLFSMVSINGCAMAGPEGEGEAEDVGTVASALGEHGTLRGLGGKCLDVQWGSTARGAPLHMWPCHGGPAQQWTLTDAGEIRGLAGRCLDVRWGDTTPGTPVHMWDCTGDPAQKWTVLPSGEIRGLGGLCLDVTDASTAAGTPVRMWPCTSSVPQQWSFSEPKTNRGFTLSTNQVLYGGDYLRFGDRTFVLQSDCNLVLYGSGGIVLWSSGTYGAGTACHAVMQSDGNLVIYDANEAAVWSTGTYGHPGARLVVQSDGNVVIYSGGFALWSTDTVRVPPPPPPPEADPRCRFSRTETKCIGVVQLCKAVYSCGFDDTLTEITRDSGWSACGACIGFDF